MIAVTRLNGGEFHINSDLIETLESTPDTVITLTTGKKLIILEPVTDVIDRIVEFRRRSFPEILARDDLLE